jgi:sterol desaturase/sphingolipid hydroxylase (fatty acid hydroxylase superfamily)
MDSVIVVLAVGVGMLAIEVWRPGREFPPVRGWVRRSLLLTAVQGFVAFAAAATWDRWMSGLAPWAIPAHGTFKDALIGYLALTFIYYWWHRARHEIPLLWRWFHQVHHSATRIELLTSFYKHPLEIVANGVLSSVILHVVLGLTPAAAGMAVTLTGLAELFYHWNVKTPYWLGFIFQRPESHCVHHQRGHHTQNFSDLPLWDILFGTFHNPHAPPGRYGFGAQAERRLPDMLRGRPIHPRRRAS